MSAVKRAVRETGVDLDRLRRQPQQQRSRKRVQDVIDAAKQLVVELDPADVTTTLIAERAGVSVAWIYQYFEDRQAIFDTIVLDAVQRIFELGQEAATSALARGWRDVIRSGLDATAAFYAAEPAFVRLWSSPFRSTDMLQSNQLHDHDQAAWLYEQAVAVGTLLAGAEAQQAIELCVRLADRGLEFAFADNPAGEREVLDMLTRSIVACIEPYAATPDVDAPVGSGGS